MRADKPDAVPLLLGERTLATAYPHRPPSTRSLQWSWRMVWSRHGSRHQRSLGRLHPGDVPQALLDAWGAIDPAALGDDDAPLNLADLLRVWYASLEDAPALTRLADNTLKNYAQDAKILVDIIGDRPATDLGVPDAKEVIRRMADPKFRATRERRRSRKPTGKGYGARTIDTTLRTFSAVLTWARESGMAVGSVRPLKYTPQDRKRSKVYVYREHTPTQDEIDDLQNTLRRDSPSILSLMVARHTGARIGEIAELTWADFEDGPLGRFVTLRGKTGTRRVALTTDTADAILACRGGAAPGDRLFTATWASEATTYLTLAQEHRKVPKERQFTYHGVRRRWSLDQIAAGVPVSVYADQAGHSPVVALRHYARVSDRDRVAAALRVQELGGRDIFAYLAERGLTVPEAIDILDEVLRARAERGEHLALAASE